MSKLIIDRVGTEIMSWSEQKKYFRFDKPATYQICVKGSLDDTWSDRLAGMDITSSRAGCKGTVTTLVGTLRDQAELMGVLNNLYEMHLLLLTVEILVRDQGDEWDQVVEKYDLKKEKREGDYAYVLF